MRIKVITDQTRRDFYAIYVCEHCNHETKGSGYDDDHFHRNVIPTMVCKECGKTAPADSKPLGTKYQAHQVV